MTQYWNPGDTVVVRWIANGRVWIAQPNTMVKDGPSETLLLMVPGTTCMVHEDVWRSGRFDERAARWDDESSGDFTLREHTWHTNRMLMILKPDAFYSVIYFWHHATDVFTGYYVNFQLPFQRSHCGFDTYDLELDIVVEPSLAWKWKDEDTYRSGVSRGNICPEWAAEVERAKPEIFAKILDAAYPFDGRWVDWRPDATWAVPTLPEGWDEP